MAKVYSTVSSPNQELIDLTTLANDAVNDLEEALHNPGSVLELVYAIETVERQMVTVIELAERQILENLEKLITPNQTSRNETMSRGEVIDLIKVMFEQGVTDFVTSIAC